ncbi:MAG: tRNA (N(6)-L-threonylcarbamoyladenosine(37)-C(2))-methylthiotransferase MtaB [Candidatus Mycalebacterium zealandia]|nr:MAG: tRNA (N(6)-L-threonylcarbamoyladenosine(37)-C(2))-methylthiotransferase MtaB [Candidatus Mycalebacterium zealandia]
MAQVNSKDAQRKISVVTLGCKANQYDTAAMLGRLPRSRYEINGNFTDKANVYVIDSCTVTGKADSEARNYARRAKKSNPRGVVVVTGCYAQVSPEEIASLKDVDYVIGNSHKFPALSEIVRKGKSQKNARVFVSDLFSDKKRKFESPGIKNFPERTRAFLKIQDGCNYACSFCIIPRARGRSRSLAPDEVLKRLETLYSNGYRETVLTGIHLASYGTDIGASLVEMIRKIENCSRPLPKIRLSSLDPADMSDELIRLCADSESVCKSFHVSLQSGDGDVLKKMRRRYSPGHFMDCADLIRREMPDASIGTDIMVGFPGETERQFQNTFEVARDSELTYFHVFPYSIRKNTSACVMDGQVSKEVKKRRSLEMRELGAVKKQSFYESFIGRTLPAISETRSICMTDNYIPVAVDDSNLKAGVNLKVRIDSVCGEKAKGCVRSFC